MGKGTVILGMSGGVDSSVAALLLQKEGYKVIGMFMNCGLERNRWPTSISWEEEEKQVRDICEKLDIELIVKDCGDGYEKKVISEMFRDYSLGLTPNPDILCNNVGKFPLLYNVMQQKNADFIATGHYARLKRVERGVELYAGSSQEKDQSYFLIGLGQKYLSRCLFPIGDLCKDNVRDIARNAGFSNWDKKGSRGICYLGKIDMKDFLHSRIKEKEGQILDDQNQVIGTHQGISFFTIGETITTSKNVVLNKYGRGSYSSDKLYIAAKKKGNILVVAKKGSKVLNTKKIVIKGFKTLNSKEDVVGMRFTARIRNLGEFNPGVLLKENNSFVFEFEKPVTGVAPGQFIVLYDGSRVVGGGEIRSMFHKVYRI